MPGCEADREAEVREAAIRLLARREHSRLELTWKLRQRGYPEALIEAALDGLSRDRLLSDRRFAEVFIRSRVESGSGPLRIRAELRDRGIDDAVISEELGAAAVDWNALARQLRQRKFGEALPKDYKIRAKQMRYLQSRGFDYEHIRAACGDGPDDFE